MKIWKSAKENPELENYLNKMLQPVVMRQEFASELKQHLLTNYPIIEKAKDVRQTVIRTIAGVVSVLMLVIAALRALLFILGMFNLIKNRNGGLRQEQSSA